MNSHLHQIENFNKQVRFIWNVGQVEEPRSLVFLIFISRLGFTEI